MQHDVLIDTISSKYYRDCERTKAVDNRKLAKI